MKRFLYAAMLASLAVTGCGLRKEAKPEKAIPAPTVEMPETDITDEELLAVLDMLDENDADGEADEAEAALEDDLDDDEDLTPEEIEARRAEALSELTEMLRMEEENNPELAAAMGADLFDPSFDIEKLSPQERESLLAWETSAVDFARKELEAAAMESDMLGFTAIQFAANSAEIPDSQKDALEKNITVARAALATGRDLVVAGHAEKGSDNPVELSQKRADALRDAFIAAGLNAEQLHAAGYGDALGDLVTPASEYSAEIFVC